MVPHAVALSDAHRIIQLAPQLGCLVCLRGSEANSDGLGQRIHGGGTVVAELGPSGTNHGRSRNAGVQGGTYDIIHPAFDERQAGFQALAGVGVSGDNLGGEILTLHPLHHLLHLRRIVHGFRGDLPGGFLNGGVIQRQAGGELLDVQDEALHQPRDVLEQAQMRGLAGGQVDQRLAGLAAQLLGHGIQVFGCDRGGIALGQRHAPLGGQHDVGGHRAQGVAQLGAEVHGVDLLHHSRQRAELAAHFFRHATQGSVAELVGQGSDHALPRFEGFVQPLRRAKGHGAGGTGGQVGGLVQPQLGQTNGIGHRLRVVMTGAGVLVGGGDPLARGALGQSVIDRPPAFGTVHVCTESGEHGTKLVQDVAQVAGSHVARAAVHSACAAAHGAAEEEAERVVFVPVVPVFVAVVIAVPIAVFVAVVIGIVRAVEAKTEFTHVPHRTDCCRVKTTSKGREGA